MATSHFLRLMIALPASFSWEQNSNGVISLPYLLGVVSSFLKSSLDVDRTKIAELEGKDAQCIADLLSMLLHEDGAFASEDGQLLFGLLKKLVRSSGVLPQCYKLQDLQCDFSHAREGGSFADIYEGEYGKRKVCVKAVRIFEKDDNTRMLKAMAKEAVLWAHLSHSNILPFYGIYLTTKGRICIFSPWMNRGDLSAHIKNHPDIPRLPLVLDVIAGLQYLHASNVVHGDLKAKNVLISDQGHALIADFGISYLTVFTNLASTRLSNGSVPWMAPELVDDDKDGRPTLQSDVWSFGCVCYEVVTSKAPFSDLANDYKILSVLMSRTRRPADGNQLHNVSVKERELMDKCWRYEPDCRPSCEEIYGFVFELVGERDQQEVHDVALWMDIRRGSGMVVNHVLAQHILLGIRGTRDIKYPASTSGEYLPSPCSPEAYFPCLPSRYDSAHDPPGSRPFPRALPPIPGLLSSGIDSCRCTPMSLSLLGRGPDFNRYQSSRPLPQPGTNAPILGPGMLVSDRHPAKSHFQSSQCTRKKKALCIGINYFEQICELGYSINHARHIPRFLCDYFRYSPEDIVLLTDDAPNPQQQPVKQNIIEAMQWLVKDARPDDTLFFHYSGHGGQIKYRDGDEADGHGEVIYPLDFEQKGYIADDLIYDIMINPLPAGCRLMTIFDSYHSGAILDLPYLYSAEGEVKECSYVKGAKADKHAKATRNSLADVISWNCEVSPTIVHKFRPEQTDVVTSSAFMHALRAKHSQSYQELLVNMRIILSRDYNQKPLLSSSHPIDTNIIFMY